METYRPKKKLVECAAGCLVTEDTARKLDEYLTTAPKDSAFRFRRKFTSPESPKEVTAETRTEVSWVSTRAVDRDREIVLPGGMQLDDYRANGVVLWNHDLGKICGRCQWIKSEDNGLIAKTQYPQRRPEYAGEWLPDLAWEYVVTGLCRSKSIGFLPLQLREPTREELGSPEYKGCEIVITEGWLFEYSNVAVGCCPEAIVTAINKGLRLDLLKLPEFTRVAKPEKKATHKAKPQQPDRQQILLKALAEVEFDADLLAAKLVDRLFGRV